MIDQSNEARAKRFLIALDLFESGVQLQRAQIRRQFPEESEAEISERLLQWLLSPRGAEHGDCPGRIVTR